ncbi:MAG: DUF3995 domain-containing protein [Micromonosporaceae bacterium]
MTTRNVPGYLAAAWAALFAVVHLYWLAGGRLGLPEQLSLFDNLPLLIIDIIAIPMCAVAAVLALALVCPWGRRLPRRLVLAGAWTTAAVLVVHAVPSMVDWVALAVGARTPGDLTALERFATFLYEPFFLAGGLLYLAATLCSPLGTDRVRAGRIRSLGWRSGL